jgi:uncharacterized membrane protein YciS (DUF1049 family)
MSPDRPLVSWSGLTEATLTVLLTSLEDCVWLVPLIARQTHARVAYANGATFVVAFTGLSLITCVLASLLQDKFGKHTKNSMALQIVGAALCWILAAFFFFKSWNKQQRRTAEKLQQQEQGSNDTPATIDGGYGAISSEQESLVDTTTTDIETNEPQSNTLQDNTAPQPWMILSFTVLGSLDEVAYFPGLIVGQVFTWAELVLASLMTSLIVLLFVDALVKHCGGCLHLLDQIPLYAVVAMFAMILSVEVVWDVVVADDN